MPNLLADQWKETLERVQDKAVHFLEKFKKSKNTDSDRERINEDYLPSFIQCGGPPLDMHESAGELIVTVEVPGLKKDDIQVELVGRRLVIRGEKKAPHEQKRTDGSYLSECSYGSFTRAIQLPYDVTDSAVKADLKAGILTVRMQKPVSEFKLPHQLTIS